ncbi:septal ring lytic transglycosylase RlpA family protein [Halomonas sp. GXIMD04776]|uniref:septal ring lytic transglycosylase RlpA family protein n=1 Tax=Halomonas sp. GXIMD04776 TaxID=3415605 RepID=UPI003C9F3554
MLIPHDDRLCRRERIRQVLILALSVSVLAGCAGGPASFNGDVSSYVDEGRASYYSDAYQGKQTASGERYERSAMTAAHPVLPFGSRVAVTNLDNGREVVVRINDRGPFVRGRIIDLSYRAAERLGMIRSGVVPVKVQGID